MNNYISFILGWKDLMSTTASELITKNVATGISRYSLFGDSENRENNYLKIRDLLSIALFNILGTRYVIHI